jgi:hypothetical protein
MLRDLADVCRGDRGDVQWGKGAQRGQRGLTCGGDVMMGQRPCAERQRGRECRRDLLRGQRGQAERMQWVKRDWPHRGWRDGTGV